MGKVSLSKRIKNRFPMKDASYYTMSDLSSVDSSSDSGLDIGGPDVESRDGLSFDEPYIVFKNPSISEYETAMDKLSSVIHSRRLVASDFEPAAKKARISRMSSRGQARASGSLTSQGIGFNSRPPMGTNLADLLLEEANLECPEREATQLPQLQTVLKTILSRAETCNGTQDLATGQPKSEGEGSSKTPPQSLQSSDGTNGNPRGNGTVNGAVNGSGRRVPQGRRQLTLCLNYPSKSKVGQVELRILSQPEEQHRARYLTEGSRGAVKDRIGSGYPTVKLFGYCKPVTLQVFIGTDQGKVQPHLFYQASKVCGKNSAPCTTKKIDGTVVLELSLLPEKDMTLSCDCIGILKERNVDVEQRLLHFGGTRSKKRSTRCRLVFRALIAADDESVEILQVASAPIVCTQPPGIPEICRKSLCESVATGNVELFVIGKNFLKDTKIVFEECSRDNCDDLSMICSPEGWKMTVLPEKDFLQPNHLICTVPPYHDIKIRHPVRVRLLVQSSGKRSEPQNFTYLPVTHVACPLPELAPLQSCVTDTGMGLVQQPPQKTADLLPTLIQLPLPQQHHLHQQEHKQQNGSILGVASSRELNSSLKHEDNNSQQMMITTLVIPSSAEGGPALSQAHILQDSQHALSNSVSQSSVETPMKQSHIQVLIMPPSSTVSVTTSPQPATTTFQDTFINNLKAKISNGVMNIGNSQHAPKEVTYRDEASAEPVRQLQQPSFPVNNANSCYASTPKEVRTIQDLLLQNSGKRALFHNSHGIGAKIGEAATQNASLQNSLHSGLGSSLENIPLQSLIQTNSNTITNCNREPNMQQSQQNTLLNAGFMMNSDGTTNEKVSDFSNMSEKQNLNSIYQLQQGIVKHEPKDLEVPVTTASNFGLSLNSVILNPVITNTVTSTLVPGDDQSMQQNVNTYSDSGNFGQNIDYFSKDSNLVISHDSNLSQPARQTESFDSIQIPNPILSNSLAGVNVSQQENNPTINMFAENISHASQDGLRMSTSSNLAPSLGKCISLSESQLMNFVQPFQVTANTSGTLDSIVNSTSSMNFQNNFQATLPGTTSSTITSSTNTCSTFSLHDSFLRKEIARKLISISENSRSGGENDGNSKMNFDTPADMNGESSVVTCVDINHAKSVIPPEEKSMLGEMSLTNEQVALEIEAMSRDSHSVSFRNLSAKLDGNTSFMESGSVNLNFQNMQNEMNMSRSMEQSSFQNSTVGSLQSDVLTSVTAPSSSNQTREFVMSDGISMVNDSSMHGNYTHQGSGATDKNLTFATTAQTIRMLDETSRQSLKNDMNVTNSVEPCCFQQSTSVVDSIQKLQSDILNSVTVSNSATQAMNFNSISENISIVNEASRHGTFTCHDADTITNATGNNVTFSAANQSMNMMDESSRQQESFSSQCINANNNTQDGNLSFTTSGQNVNVTSEQSLSSVSDFRDAVVIFTNGTQSVRLPVQGTSAQYAQQNTDTVNSAQGDMTTFTNTTPDLTEKVCPEGSMNRNLTTSSNIQGGDGTTSSNGGNGPSMDQMSTMMSLLPEAELMKLINPSTFDKM